MSSNYVEHRPPAAKTSTPKGAEETAARPSQKPQPDKKAKEIGGPAGPEPTRYGDWEIKGRCIDF